MMDQGPEASIVTSSGVFGELQPLEESWDDVFGANDQTASCSRLPSMHSHSLFKPWLALLRQCRDLGRARLLHRQLVEAGYGHSTFLANLVIQMYGKCGSPSEARAAFQQLGHRRDARSWSFLLGAYARSRSDEQVLRLVAEMGQQGIPMDEYTLIYSVAAWSRKRRLDLARSLFDRLHNGNVVAWTSMLAAYAQQGEYERALELYRDMGAAGVEPTEVTYLTVLAACTAAGALDEGKAVHARLLSGRYASQVSVRNALLTLYAKCGCLEQAEAVFRATVGKTVISWTGMITAYAQLGYAAEAVHLYFRMQLEGVSPNSVTFVGALSACSDLRCSRVNRAVFSCIRLAGVAPGSFPVQNAAMSVYAKAGQLEEASRVFQGMAKRDVVSWNTMLAAYAQHGQCREAVQLHRRMDLEGVGSNCITYASLLGAFSSHDALELGKSTHRRITSSSCRPDDVLLNALLNMYAKCGAVAEARYLFQALRARDSVSWNIIIGACVQQGLPAEALDYYDRMDVEPTALTFASVLGACSSHSALAQGKRIHHRLLAARLESDQVVQSALISMYGKCGQLETAKSMFNSRSSRNLVLWNVMIALHAQHGSPAEALELHSQMESEGVKPDALTLVALLVACNHAGWLAQGHKLFISLCGADHAVAPLVEHYHLLVDLLGRAGRLEEAEQLIADMPCDSTGVGLRSLLGCFKIHGEARRGMLAAERALQLYPGVPSGYVCLSDMYRGFSS